MKTFETLIEYRESENTSHYYRNDSCIATLNFDGDVFESDEDLSEEDKDEIYAEMIKDRDEYNNQGSSHPTTHEFYTNIYN